jgi:hypothetical protein
MTEIELAKQQALNGMEMFLRNFSKVPDDRLNWKPTPTANSPIRVAAHTALYAGRFAAMIQSRDLPQPDNLEAWIEARYQEEIALTDRIKV